ncbi:MAG TPA: patatin-like phospholipase family protein [Acidimicrobiia bacterium]|nr:patatin-like phospholipase family protein [Acidimicrobiia bacterium]
MSRVGLVLGGGGITGASYHLAALLAINMATGWHPNDAEVIVGTSAGSFVASTVRAGDLSIDSIVRPHEGREQVAERIRNQIYQRQRPGGVVRWVHRGLLPGLRKPGVTMLLGTPALHHAGGIADWVEEQTGEMANSWPDRATVIVAYDIAGGVRVAFGTEDAPDVALKDAVAASSAVPVIFSPYEIDKRYYVDGGVVSGTHADLLLGNADPLDLVLVLAPMAADEPRTGAHFYEGLFDRVGRTALNDELQTIGAAWPDTDILVLRPSPMVLEAMRPNPMEPAAAVPTFVRTLASLRNMLARPDVWNLLDRHLNMHTHR